MYYKSKYHNTKITRNGITFDSRKEADFYSTLLYREKANEVCDIERQVTFELIPNQYETEIIELKSGKTKERKKLVERAIKYIVDFIYFDKLLNQKVYVDVKGLRTKDYIIKRKLMLYMTGIKIEEM